MSELAQEPRSGIEDRFRAIFDSVSDGIFVSDASTGRIMDVNPAGCAMFGAPRTEMIGNTIGALSVRVPPYTQRDAMAWFEKVRVNGPQTFEWHCKAKSGQQFWAEIALRYAEVGGHGVGLAIVRNITERKRKEDELAERARLDVLTGLSNRRDFDFILEQEMARSDRHGAALSVAMGDIDHFKEINDSFGHQAGDAVLRSMADFMRKRLRRIDCIARWGGEEFTLVLPETKVEFAEALLNRLRASIANNRIPEIGRPVTLSFGVTAYHKPDTAEELLARIDAALYASKQGGRNKVSRA